MSTVVAPVYPLSVDVYDGFEVIQINEDRFRAIPRGWSGEMLEAESLPAIRKKIWNWWNHVELELAP